jgi:hypothetical protein
MKMISPCLLGLSLAVASCTMAAAQDSSPATASLPMVLQITREFVKPYKGGAPHDKTEGAFVQAMARAKWPTHYIALNSMSGKSRALYLTAYDSFAAWEKDNKAIGDNKALSAELDRASVADGELLDEVDQGVYSRNVELSYKPNPDLTHARYLEATVYHVRPGHFKEFSDAVKMVIAIHQRAGTAAHWSTFHLEYGGSPGTYVMLSSDKSMSEIDASFDDDKKYAAARTDEERGKIREMIAVSVESSDNELFSINPRQSYPPAEFVKGDPDFWQPKPAVAPAAKPAAKPTAASKP